MCIRYRGNVSTEPLPSNGKGIFTEPLPSIDRGLHTQTDERDVLIRLLRWARGEGDTLTDSNVIS
jgi:hypothetical protein